MNFVASQIHSENKAGILAPRATDNFKDFTTLTSQVSQIEMLTEVEDTKEERPGSILTCERYEVDVGQMGVQQVTCQLDHTLGCGQHITEVV